MLFYHWNRRLYNLQILAIMRKFIIFAQNFLIMITYHISAFKDCYIMQKEDIEHFANTLADGFSRYNLFEYVCNGEYDHNKMSLSWRVSLALAYDNAICIADSKDFNSVLVYIRPKSKEPGLIDYLKMGGGKMLFAIGLRSVMRLLRFEALSKRVAKQYQTENDGYLMAFATRLDKQGQNYGKPLIEALLRYLDASGEGCYLETLKAENVAMYEHFSFQFKEQKALGLGDLTLYAMYRPGAK